MQRLEALGQSLKVEGRAVDVLLLQLLRKEKEEGGSQAGGELWALMRQDERRRGLPLYEVLML